MIGLINLRNYSGGSKKNHEKPPDIHCPDIVSHLEPPEYEPRLLLLHKHPRRNSCLYVRMFIFSNYGGNFMSHLL
jgi:hypothetical protein